MPCDWEMRLPHTEDEPMAGIDPDHRYISNFLIASGLTM